MSSKCQQCGLINFQSAEVCIRCQSRLTESENITAKRPFSKSRLLKRIALFVFASLFALIGFYISLVVSAKPITYDERRSVDRAVALLDEREFSRETWYLKYLTSFRSSDNWLNASVEKENAYAATNFPFEIMTLYSDYFTVPLDDTERAAILLHEAKHLQGKDEKGAYEFVWRNRKQLGWTSDKYKESDIWQNVRKQTREYSPNLFICEFKEFGDCTE
jgi:hypothetical protein